MSKQKQTKSSASDDSIQKTLSGFERFKQAQQNRGFNHFKPQVSSHVMPKFGKRGDR